MPSYPSSAAQHILARARESSQTLDREHLVGRYRALRERSHVIFDLLDPDLYYTRPIALRNPIVFYEGHLPAFAVNTLIKKGLGRPGLDAHLERVFARGIDPETEATAHARHGDGWPSREEVQRYVLAADRLIEDALRHAAISRAGVPVLDRAEGVFTLLEHEALHQETLLYMWHRIPHDRKRRPAYYAPRVSGGSFREDVIDIPAGIATLGARRGDVVFGWDNEFPAHDVEVAAVGVDRFNVTNRQFLAFVEAGGYADRRWWTEQDWNWIQSEAIGKPLFWERQGDGWVWRGQFEWLSLPELWPVYVSHAEAAAYARWRGARLMTEAEYHRAAFGTPDGQQRRWPWGDAPPAEEHGTFDFASWDPLPVGSSPAGASAWGVHDLMGNGWEWTSTPFMPFDGFVPMPSYPEYSAEFFDGEHFVIKGASPVTARDLLRRSLRNWFRPHYPFVYATFRCTYDRRTSSSHTVT
jgi:ergothioneine biosynthesis protein EgtB